MNLYHLRYFVVLAHVEHYTKAAKQLRITQPTLSNAMALLETELGVSLFEKEGRNVVLTKWGKKFHSEVEHALNVLDSSVHDLKQISKGTGHIDVALLRTLSYQLVPQLVNRFINENPDKEVSFQFYNSTGMSQDMIKGLKEREYDFAFCSKVEDEESIAFVPIAKQELVLIVPENHPLAIEDEIDLADTLHFPQIWFSERSGMRPIVENLFSNFEMRPLIQYEVEEDETIAGLVAQGFGIAVIPRIPILELMNIKVLNIQHPKWERLFYMAYLKEAYQIPAIETFKNYVIETSPIVNKE